MTTSSVFDAGINSTSLKDNESHESSTAALGLCAIVIGIVGSVANLFDLIHVCHKQKNEDTGVYLLNINQNVLDVIACLFLSLSYAIKQTKIFLSGNLGDWLWTIFYSDSVIWIGLTGSVANQVIVAFLLYFEAKHFSLYTKLFRRWLIYLLIALTWVDGTALNNPFALTSYVRDGVCYSTGIWTTKAGHVAFGAWAFVWEYLLPVTLTAYCYGSILSEVRRRTMTVSPTSSISSHCRQTTHFSANILLLSQTNSVKANATYMVLYAVFWFPCHMCLFILSWRFLDIKLDDTYTASFCLGCLQISLLGPLINSIHDGSLIKRMQAVVARCHTESSATEQR